MCAARRNSWCNISGLYTLLKSVQGHAACMSFSHSLDHHLHGLHFFSRACQRGLTPVWMSRRILLSFSSFQNCHSRILPIDYFWKVILIPRLPPLTSHMSSYKTFQNPIPVCRLVFPTSWERREGESCWVLQGPFSWGRLIQGKAEGNYLVLLVMWQIY